MSKKIKIINNEYNLGTQSTSRSATPDQGKTPIIEKIKSITF
jgi:hypothetical protein